MVWIVVDVGLAVLGLVVLGLLALRLWRQVRVLGREVRAAGERIQTTAATLNEMGERHGSAASGRSGGPAGVA